MRVLLITVSVLALNALSAAADPRIHEARVPAWCAKELNNTGACVRGPAHYEVVGGQVVWTDPENANSRRFWEYQDKKAGGTADTAATSQ